MTKPLKITNISHAYADAPVLDSVSLSVNKNEIFGFVGLNGVGKTTLIKIILDLLDQDSGEVEIFSVNKILPQARAKICYLPEKFQPSWHLTGAEFLNFSLSFYGVKPDKERVSALCKNLELDFSALSKKVTQYSKGMTQKLGLLAVFLSDADLIILDEPMSGLDPQARVNLKNELLNYKNQQKSMFFSSHILHDVDEICDKIAILHNGKIAFEGAPQAFKTKQDEQNLEKAFLRLVNLKT